MASSGSTPNKTMTTLLGFRTENVTSGALINIAYVVVVVMAYMFALHAMRDILYGWSPFWVTLAALAAVALPYSLKVSMFRMPRYTVGAAFIATFISFVPFVFDAMGLYSSNGIETLERESKGEMSKILRDFDINSRALAVKSAGEISAKESADLAEVRANYDSEVKALELANISARHLLLDEERGVRRGDLTTGLVGVAGGVARVESDMRRTEDAGAVEKRSLDAWKVEREAAIHAEAALGLAAIKAVNNELDKLVGTGLEVAEVAARDTSRNATEKSQSLIDQIEDAENFRTLSTLANQGNKVIHDVATALAMDPNSVKDLEVEWDDNLTTFASRVLAGDLTAIFVVLIAFLFEIMDCWAAYFLRRLNDDEAATAAADQS